MKSKRKHKIGKILSDNRYVEIIKLIYQGVDQPKTICERLELYSSLLSDKLGNISGKHYNFIKTNGQTKKDLIRYQIDYSGILNFLLDKFLGNYFPKDKGKIQGVHIYPTLIIKNSYIIKKLKFYLDYMLLKKDYTGNCFNLFEQFIVKIFLYSYEQEIRYKHEFGKFDKNQQKIIRQNLNKSLKFTFPKLQVKDQLIITGDNIFVLLCKIYCQNKLENKLNF